MEILTQRHTVTLFWTTYIINFFFFLNSQDSDINWDHISNLDFFFFSLECTIFIDRSCTEHPVLQIIQGRTNATFTPPLWSLIIL